MAWRDNVRDWADRLRPSGLLYSTYETRLLGDIDPQRLPKHVAVMADGNRRWARLNAPGSELTVGYQAGADKLKQFVVWCDEVGIKVVTEGNDLILVSEQGVLIRIPVEEVRRIGRNTQGVQLMNLDANDRVSAVAQVVTRDDD